MSKLIGILGGTFDPIHFGHLRPALEVMQSAGLEQVRFLPNRQPPHRPQPWLDEQTRCDLVATAISDVPEFVLDDRELKRDGPSWMVDTLASLKQDFPRDSLCLIMGMDAFAGFTHWHRWQDIFDLCHLIVMSRPGTKLPDFQDENASIQPQLTHDVSELANASHGKILLQSVTLLDISATLIRENLLHGQSIRYLVPDNVREKLENRYAAG